MQRGNVLLLSRLNILQGGKNRIRHWIGSFLVRKQFGQIADIRQGKIGRRHCIDGRTGVQAKREHRQRQDRFPAGFARCRGFGLFGLVLRFRCRGHVRRPQMSEQKTEPSLDRPRDGSSTRHSSNWPGVWADEINSTLSPQRRLGASRCRLRFLAGRRRAGLALGIGRLDNMAATTAASRGDQRAVDRAILPRPGS